jgi:hypothetical protein
VARNNRQANTELRKTGSSAVANAGGASPAHRSLVFGAIIVGVITFIAFLPALSNQFVDWDDPDNFLRNTHFRGLGWENIKWMFSTFRMGHYQPLTWLTLGLDSVIGESLYGNELDPRPYHFTNVVLHAVNAALVFVLALRLLQRAGWTSPRGLIIGAMFAGLFFGVHPLRVESVAWATERRDGRAGVSAGEPARSTSSLALDLDHTSGVYAFALEQSHWRDAAGGAADTGLVSASPIGCLAAEMA